MTKDVLTIFFFYVKVLYL